MPTMRSTVGFTSNLYPVPDDKSGFPVDFLSSLDDAKALSELYEALSKCPIPPYRLTTRQDALRGIGTPCVFSPPGDFPWGIHQKGGPIVCECRQTNCKHYLKCHK